MLIKRPADIRPSAITDKQLYLSRRRFLRDAGSLGLSVPVLASGAALLAPTAQAGAKLEGLLASSFSSNEPLTSYDAVTSYNNFYEFGTDKSAPAQRAGQFKPRPWSVAVAGECNKPGVYALEDIIKPHQLEERIYRLRCVEAWSMVIPWVGIPLGDILKRFEPRGDARYVSFTTVIRPTGSNP